jgi:hypothetical protein
MLTLTTINEGTSGRFRGTLTDEDGAPVNGATITRLLISLVEASANAVVNAWDRVLVWENGAAVGVGVGRVTITEAGVLTLTLTPADMAMLRAVPQERHLIVLQFTWPSHGLTHTAPFNVAQVPMVP